MQRGSEEAIQYSEQTRGDGEEAGFGGLGGVILHAVQEGRGDQGAEPIPHGSDAHGGGGARPRETASTRGERAECADLQANGGETAIDGRRAVIFPFSFPLFVPFPLV